MKHLRVSLTPEDIARVNAAGAARKTRSAPVLSPEMKEGEAACLAKLEPLDELVDSALEAECDGCRVAVGVAKKGDKTWEGKEPIGVKPAEKWEEQPMADAEALIKSAMNNRG